MDELLQSKLPWRINYIPKPTPRHIPKNVTDLTIQLIGHPPSLSVLEDTMSSEDLENEMTLLELEESKPNLPITGVNANLDSYIADVRILPVIYHIFEETRTSMTILLDEGSNTSLITTQVVKNLGLKGETKSTSIYKAGEKTI